MRRSLGDEIKRLGVLGSPFCDKTKYSSPRRENLVLRTNSHNDSFDISSARENNCLKETSAHDLKEHSVCVETPMKIHSENIGCKNEILVSLTSPTSLFGRAVAFLNLYTNHRLQLLFQKVFWC